MHFDITKDPTAVRLEEAVKKPWCPYKSVGWLKNALQEFDAPFLETDWVTPAACEYLTKLQQEKEQSRLRARNPKQNRPQLSAKTSCLAPTLLEKIVANIEKSLRLWETGFFRRLKELLRDENT